MKAEIKDENQALTKSLNAIGYKLTPLATETILNVAELVKEKKLHVTLAELITMEMCVKGLFEK